MMSDVSVHSTRDLVQRAETCEIGRAAELFSSLPRELGERFRPRIAVLAGDILRKVQRTVPEYARPLEGPFGTVIVYGVRLAITHAVDNVGGAVVLRQPWVHGFRYLGKVEFHEGRDIDCLLRAYRVGGRVAWRHFAAAARAIDLPPDIMQVAGEATFAYVEELSALSVQGYAAARRRAGNDVPRQSH